MTPARKASAIRTHLEQRIASALEWYVGCDVVEETRTNINLDLRSVLEDTARHFGIKRFPFLLQARFEGSTIVVRQISTEVS